MQSHPCDTRDFAHLIHQLSKLEITVYITSVIRRILSDQADFLHTLSCQLLHLSYNRFHRTAAKCSAHNRNTAKSTVIIAAFSNFHIGRVFSRR
ncbi:hypothetical protein D3C73_1215420 [compost metagenome]